MKRGKIVTHYNEAKPFCISRGEVWEAYLRVKSKQGAAGLEGQSIEEFERDLKKNLYRIWMRWDRLGRCAGSTTGFATWTSRVSWIWLHTAPWFMRVL
jgi:hypothetical protein